MKTAPVDLGGAVDGYERLRRCAFGERVDEPGLGLFMRRGLRAWIEARADVPAKAPISATGTGSAYDSAAVGRREELARLIATMVIDAVQTEVRTYDDRCGGEG